MQRRKKSKTRAVQRINVLTRRINKQKNQETNKMSHLQNQHTPNENLKEKINKEYSKHHQQNY